MSARVNRRAMLAAMAGAPALAVPAVEGAAPAPGASPEVGASLPALVAERERLNAIHEAADHEELEAWDALAPERLCTLGPRIFAGWFCSGDDGVPVRRWFYSEDQIRAYYTDPRRPPCGSDDEIARMIAERCRQLADARITWARRKAEVGLPAIEARVDAAAAALCAIEQQIENTPARTFADAVALVRYASQTIPDDSCGYEALQAALACFDHLAGQPATR